MGIFLPVVTPASVPGRVAKVGPVASGGVNLKWGCWMHGTSGLLRNRCLGTNRSEETRPGTANRERPLPVDLVTVGRVSRLA